MSTENQRFSSPRSICCLRYHRSLYSYSSFIPMVWLECTVLAWLQSYLSSRNFIVNIIGTLSAPFPLLQGVPQGSVLGPLLFILYTTPLSSLISDSSVNHHLYADDTELFISFSVPDFSQNFSHLETTIDTVSTWMAANLLWLNQSKTEFLLIGLPKQLSKVSDAALPMPSNVSITPSDSARNLGVIFDSSLTMSDHNSSASKSWFLPIRDLRRIRSTVDFATAKTIAIHLSLIPRLTIAILSFSTFLALNLIVFSWFSTLLFALFLELLISPIFHLFWNLYIGSQLINAFTTKFSQSPTKHSNFTTPPICTIFSVSNLTRALVLLPMSLSNARQFALDLK